MKRRVCYYKAMQNTPDPRIKKSINLAYEAGSLRSIKRLWAQVLGPTVANNLEHSYRVMLMALIISRMEGKGDEGTILKMGLLHDLCETRSTDIAFLHRMYVERHEEKSMHDQLTGTLLEPDLATLAIYEQRESIESRIVKDADDIDIDLELQELAAHGNEAAKRFITHNRAAVKAKLYTESAKKLWDMLYATRPDEWQDEITHLWALTRKDKKK
jgi:putative hydrolases of HD superfamily